MSDIRPIRLDELNEVTIPSDEMIMLIDPMTGNDLGKVSLETLDDYFVNIKGYVNGVAVDGTQVPTVNGIAQIELQSRFDAKADQSYVDSNLSTKVDNSTFTSAINNLQSTKADANTVNQALSLKADTSYVNQQLNLKVNRADYNTDQQAIQQQINAKANTTDVNNGLNNKVDKVVGYGLSQENYTTNEKGKLASIPADAEYNAIMSISQDGTILTPDGSRNVNIDLSAKANAADVSAALDDKVDKVEGYDLSENNYTTAEKDKLASIQAQSERNAIVGIIINSQELTIGEDRIARGSVSGGGGDTGNVPDPAGSPNKVLRTNPTADGFGWGNNITDIISVSDTLPTGSFNNGDLTYLTTDNRLYRNDGTNWIDYADPVDNMIYRSSSNIPYALKSGTLVAFVQESAGIVDFDTPGSVQGTLGYAYGGTGATSYTTGSIIKAGATGFTDAVAGTDYAAPPPSGMGYSSNDYTTTEKNKLAGVDTGAQVNVIENVALNNANLTISNKRVNIDLSGYPTNSVVNAALALKVDKVAGKGLSTNDYTDEEKTKLSQLYPVNLSPDSDVILDNGQLGRDSDGSVKMGDGITAWADLPNITGSQFPALSMLIMPCALNGADALGWTLQGGQVTNAMSPQLYQRILAEYNAGTTLDDSVVVSNVENTNVTVIIPCRRSASSGLKIVDIADRAAVDGLYAQTGSAFYIILDQANAVFYLPRFNDGATFTGDITQVGVYGKDQIVNFPGSFPYSPASQTGPVTGPFIKNADGPPSGDWSPVNLNGKSIDFNPNIVVNTGDRVQGRNVKLFVYFRTGDRVVNAQDIDMGGIQAALNLKANTDLSNVSSPHIIETWHSEDGLSWYRIYSDGWIEQGGLINTTGLDTPFNFLIPFTSAESIQLYLSPTDGTTASVKVIAAYVLPDRLPTTTNVIVRYAGISNTGSAYVVGSLFYWEAKGY